MKKILISLGIVLVLVGAYKLFFKTTPPPGEFKEDKGREHVTDIYGVEYSSNPPTSGPHFPTWAGRGVYDRVLSDGYLLHSLEHGYVVISYNCTKLLSSKFIPVVSAHEEEEIVEDTATPSGTFVPLMHMKFKGTPSNAFFTPSDAPEKEVELPEAFQSDKCKALVNELSQFVEGDKRVIVVPRLNMDVPVALTAWNRLENLGEINKERIKAFIEAFENRGPEKTME